MAIPVQDKRPGSTVDETGAHKDKFLVSSVSSLFLFDLVNIDSTWNKRSWSYDLFNQELANPNARVKGLFVAKKLVGYLIAHVVLEEAHVVTLGIDPEWRGKGGGSALFAEFMRSAKAEGVTVFTLDVRVSNFVAQALYEKFGFQTVNLRKNYYSDNGEDALTMRLEVQ